jgi:hypothetical protein
VEVGLAPRAAGSEARSSLRATRAALLCAGPQRALSAAAVSHAECGVEGAPTTRRHVVQTNELNRGSLRPWFGLVVFAVRFRVEMIDELPNKIRHAAGSRA